MAQAVTPVPVSHFGYHSRMVSFRHTEFSETRLLLIGVLGNSADTLLESYGRRARRRGSIPAASTREAPTEQGRGFVVSRFAGLRLRHAQDDAAAQAAPVLHLVEDVGGVFEGPPGNVGTYVVSGGELEGVTDVLT